MTDITDDFSTAMEEERVATVSDRISADLVCGKASDVVGELRTLTAEHPLWEPLWGQLITALYLSGRQADALAACRRVRAILADELASTRPRRLSSWSSGCTGRNSWSSGRIEPPSWPRQ